MIKKYWEIASFYKVFRATQLKKWSFSRMIPIFWIDFYIHDLRETLLLRHHISAFLICRHWSFSIFETKRIIEMDCFFLVLASFLINFVLISIYNIFLDSIHQSCWGDSISDVRIAVIPKRFDGDLIHRRQRQAIIILSYLFCRNQPFWAIGSLAYQNFLLAYRTYSLLQQPVSQTLFVMHMFAWYFE